MVEWIVGSNDDDAPPPLIQLFKDGRRGSESDYDYGNEARLGNKVDSW